MIDNNTLVEVLRNIKDPSTGIDLISAKRVKDLKIEGLKAEKRMIQATDRKMLDVQRQTAIDEELKKLEK